MKYVIHTSKLFFDQWAAVLDGYDGADLDYDTGSRDPIGRGATEADAVKDLIERIEEGRE